ncbi:MAG: hypothetical protein CFH41_02789 [Alphaproteobacteria bacterium MarineAlpha11_Bin1]|nr:MAG: hypothetical protein CFH41_02789 [Alphaproteobacteria bacterium MarineAlpha11_Bin1]|tara:strand:+ start:6820 stop:7278 length:459 start_codon:yes stop_codon:yes gene_type:complete
MPLTNLEHFLIQTGDFEGTVNQHTDVLGMEEGPHPDFKIAVSRLYIGRQAVQHVTVGGEPVSENWKKYLERNTPVLKSIGVVDCVTYRASGLREMMVHLDVNGMAYTERKVEDHELSQRFLMDPYKEKVELNFIAEKARGISSDVSTVDISD